MLKYFKIKYTTNTFKLYLPKKIDSEFKIKYNKSLDLKKKYILFNLNTIKNLPLLGAAESHKLPIHVKKN